MVPDASSSVQLCAYVNLFFLSPLGPQVADTVPHVPLLLLPLHLLLLLLLLLLFLLGSPSVCLRLTLTPWHQQLYQTCHSSPSFSRLRPPSLSPPTASRVHTSLSLLVGLLSQEKKKKKEKKRKEKQNDPVVHWRRWGLM